MRLRAKLGLPDMFKWGKMEEVGSGICKGSMHYAKEGTMV
jgi:hypothetical protein